MDNYEQYYVNSHKLLHVPEPATWADLEPLAESDNDVMESVRSDNLIPTHQWTDTQAGKGDDENARGMDDYDMGDGNTSSTNNFNEEMKYGKRLVGVSYQ